MLLGAKYCMRHICPESVVTIEKPEELLMLVSILILDVETLSSKRARPMKVEGIRTERYPSIATSPVEYNVSGCVTDGPVLAQVKFRLEAKPPKVTLHSGLFAFSQLIK